MKSAIIKFAGFSGIGVFAFLIDFALLAFLTEVAGINYLRAAGFAFVFATSLHYLAARRIVFRTSSRSYLAGYPYFIAIALINLGLTLALMKIAVEDLNLYYLLARPLVSCVVGIINFVVNTNLTFKSYFTDGPQTLHQQSARRNLF